MTDLVDKIAIITGGASGIGAATAKLFIEAGAWVVIADIQDQRGEALAMALGDQAIYQHADVTQEADVQALVQQTMQRFQRLDCMINNAGGVGGGGGALAELTLASFDLTLNVNLRGAFLGMKHAIPVMQQQGKGAIVNTASVAGLRTGYAGHAYSAAKAAVIQLTRTAAMEVGVSGIRVNCVCPGGIATPIFGKAFGLSNEQADQTLPALQAFLPTMDQALLRAGLPEDIGRAILWLASDASAFVTGHALVVDGGLIPGQTATASAQMYTRMAAAMNL